MIIKTINPSTEEVIEEYNTISKDEITTKTKKAKDAFGEWKKDHDKRENFLYAFANEFRKDRENMAKIASIEMRKAIKEARSEVDK